MPLFRSCPLEELVIQATSEKNVDDKWELILDICDKAVNYEEGPKLILPAIAKRLYSNVPRVVVQALLLLDACVKNCGKRFHLEVSSRNFVMEIRKILQKMHPATVDKFKSLIKKWAENDFKDDPELGLIPSLYYQLKSEGTQFPEDTPEKKPVVPLCTNPDAVSSQEEEEDIVKAIELSLKETKRVSTFADDISNGRSITEAVKVELCKVRALYDFEAVEENELTIQAGEIVLVTDKSNDSWWKGTNQRGEGYFPVNFVTEDLDAEIKPETEVNQLEEPKEEVQEVIEKPAVIDEGKIQIVLDLLNEVVPTDNYSDDEEMLTLERECYAMGPLVDEKLQEIDKKFTILDSLNEEIMKAIQMYNKLTRDSIMSAQSLYYYNVPTGVTQENEPTQETPTVQPNTQSSATLPRLVAKHAANPVSDNTMYISSGYISNSVNLPTTQIRPSVISVPIAYPTQCHVPQYATLPHKPNTGQHPVGLPNTIANHHMPVRGHTSMPLDEAVKLRTLSAGHDGLLMLPPGVGPHTQNCIPVIRQYPAVSSAAMRNAVLPGHVYSPVRPVAIGGSTVPGQHTETSVAPTTISSLENTITTNVIKQEVYNSQSNTGVVAHTNIFPESSLPPSNIAPPRERPPGNIANQNGSVL